MAREQQCKVCGGAHPSGACTQSDAEKLGMDAKGFKVGDTVKVRRTSGQVEDGWRVKNIWVREGTTMVMVVNGERSDALVKGISTEELFLMQNMRTEEEDHVAKARRGEPVSPGYR